MNSNGIASSALLAGIYNVDPNHTNVGFTVRHMVVANVKGQFDKFGGTFVLDEKTKTLKSLVGEVDVGSVNTNNAQRDADLKSANFFDAARFPTMELVLDDVEGNTAYGKLTIHGITKDIQMDFETSDVSVKDPWGSMRTGLSLSGSINRKDFGLNWDQTIENGALIAGDKIQINVEIEGILVE
jgi:polyisoprenoid-binding protein YceI